MGEMQVLNTTLSSTITTLLEASKPLDCRYANESHVVPERGWAAALLRHEHCRSLPPNKLGGAKCPVLMATVRMLGLNN